MHECSNFTHNSPKAEATEGPSAREWVKKSRCIHTSEYLPWGGGVSPPESHRTGRSEEHLVRLHPWKVQNPAKQIHGDGSQPSPCGTLWEGRAGPGPGQEGPSGARAGNGGRGEQCTGTSVCTQTYGHVDIKASFYKGFIFEEPYTCSLPPPTDFPIIHVCHQSGTFVTRTNQQRCAFIIRSPQLTLGLSLGVVRSLALAKCVQTHTYQHRVYRVVPCPKIPLCPTCSAPSTLASTVVHPPHSFALSSLQLTVMHAMLCKSPFHFLNIISGCIWEDVSG